MDLHYFIWEEHDVYEKALLIKDSAFNKDNIMKHYGSALGTDFIAYAIPYYKNKRPEKEFIKEIIPVLKDLGVKYLYIADANFFKLFTKLKKAESHLGYEIDAHDMKVTLGVNYQSIIYNPLNQHKLDISLNTFKGMLDGSLVTLGDSIIHRADYVLDYSHMRDVLRKLLSCPILAVDIETTSLSFWKAGIVSIAFAIDEHNGVSILIDHDDKKLQLLRKFFENYQGKTIWHNSNYDLKVLIYVLFMKSLGDTHGLLHGLEVLTRNFDDTKIMSYLALNSVTRPSYSLKDLCHEFAGNYAVEIENIESLTKEEILEYNLIDTLCTFWLYKQMPVENQELYEDLMKGTAILLLQTELTGIPIHMNRVVKLRNQLLKEKQEIEDYLFSLEEVNQAIEYIRNSMMVKKNLTLKKTKHTIDMYKHVQFNFNSNHHLRVLLFKIMNMPSINTTDTGLPATDRKTLLALENHATEASRGVLEALVKRSAIEKILSSFIPAFMENSLLTDNGYHLFGNFNIGGTASGRLSSSNPNLQNIPSNSTYGKLVKQCFTSHPDYFFCGADFASLEDRIFALLTKDPAREAVYIQGYDGHSLRTYNYWKDQIDIPQLPVDSPLKCFKITVGEEVFFVTEEDSLTIEGKSVTVKELLYENQSNH